MSEKQPNWKTICESLRCDPSAWEATSHRLTHTSGISFWIANGMLFLRTEDSTTDVPLGFMGKWRVWTAYKIWKRWQVPMLMNQKKAEGEDEF